MKITIQSLPIALICGIFHLGCLDKASSIDKHSSINLSNSSQNMATDSIIIKLIEQLTLPDATTREQAVTNLVKQGGKAVPLLTKKIETPNAPARDLMMQALATIGDTASVPLFQASLKDENARLRAMAALGLVKVNHPEAIDALITTLHAYGNETSPFTTSANALIDYGEKALPKVVLLLSDSNFNTREMGYNVLIQIVRRIPEYRYKWKELQTQLGSYNPAGTPADRESASKNWEQWVKVRAKNIGH